MRLATLSFTVALLYGLGLRAQNQTLIEPGDILVVKLVSKWETITKMVAVTPDGKLKPPALRGIGPSEDISVGGLGLDDATQRVQQSYPLEMVKGARIKGGVQVIIERGTVDQLLRQ